MMRLGHPEETLKIKEAGAFFGAPVGGPDGSRERQRSGAGAKVSGKRECGPIITEKAPITIRLP